MAKVTSSRGRMNDDEEKCIQNNLVEIERTVEANHLVTHLFASDIITLDDKMEITSAESRQKRIRLLVDKIILQGGPLAFTEFIKSLENSHYFDLVAKLIDPNSITPRGDDDVDGTKKWKTDTNFDLRLELLKDRFNKLNEKVSNLDDLKIDIAVIRHSLKEIKMLTAKEAETKMTIEMLTQQLNEKTKKLEEAERQIDLLESKIQELEEHRRKDKMELKGLKCAITRQDFTINILKGAMTKQDMTISTLNDTIGQQRKEMEKMNEDIQYRLKELEKKVPPRYQHKQRSRGKVNSKNRFDN